MDLLEEGKKLVVIFIMFISIVSCVSNRHNRAHCLDGYTYCYSSGFENEECLIFVDDKKVARKIQSGLIFSVDTGEWNLANQILTIQYYPESKKNVNTLDCVENELEKKEKYITVVDNDTKEPISYSVCSLFVGSDIYVDTSGIDGTCYFSSLVEQPDSVMISYVGQYRVFNLGNVNCSVYEVSFSIDYSGTRNIYPRKQEFLLTRKGLVLKSDSKNTLYGKKRYPTR